MRPGILLSAIAIAVLAAPVESVAETTSWKTREISAGTSVPKGKTSAVKSQRVEPAPPSGSKSLGPATAPSPSEPGTGDNAAYEAFDQGKYLTALDLAQKSVAKGDPQAHTLIGRLYAEGFGVPMDPATAARWYGKGAELGDMEAAFALGVLHAQGRGVPRSYPEAAKLLELAASKGHVLANYNLALLFLKGEGKPLNPHRALEHMRYAAERGTVAAQYDLGTLYATGTGTDPDAFEAAKWIGRAASQGHTDAEVDYAVILFRGHGVPPDQKRGAELFMSAAEKGVAVAQNRLARCYANGAGVDKNIAEALKWYYIAKAGGIDDEVLEALAAKQPRADRLRAEQAAAAWRDKSQIQ
jgi:TPR repeat protein